MTKWRFAQYPVWSTKMFAPCPDVRSWDGFEFEICFHPRWNDTIQNNIIKTLMNNTVLNEDHVKMTSTRNSCWCCLIDHLVYHFLSWQNEQHAIKYEIARQLHSRSRQTVVYNRYTVVEITNERDRIWLDKTKRNKDEWLVKHMIERAKQTENETKLLKTNE